MYSKGLAPLAAATAVTLTAAFALVFFYAPNDADQGFIQKIFYVHVPMAIVALCGFVAGGVFAIKHLRSGDSSWDLRSYVAIHLSIILGVGVLAVAASFLWGRREIAICATGAGALIGWDFLQVAKRISDVRERVRDDSEGGLARALGEMAAEATQLQWGWGVLISGAILLLISAGLPPVPEERAARAAAVRSTEVSSERSSPTDPWPR